MVHAPPFCRDEACVACDATDGSDAACADLDPDAPVCNDGQCVQCNNDNASACTGETPVCDTEANLCIPCNEYAQCPDSACHLDGPDAGGCFDQSDVQEIANAAQLNTALAALAADDQAVLVLASGTYNTSVDVASSAEVAIVGDGSPVITGDGGLNAIELIGDSITYFQGVEIANISGNGASCSGTAIWLDDTELRNNAQVGLDISGGCAAHLRRTVVAVNNGGGIDAAGGELRMANSAVGLNGNDVVPLFGGLNLNGTTLDITYSAVAGNVADNDARASMFCAGGESGSIRNSIIVAGDNSVDGCSSSMFDNNAVDDSGLGGSNENVGAVMAAWFENLGMNNYRLTTAGESELMNIAQWQDGDPLTDIDGQPIPTDMLSLPGYHQP